MAPPTKVGSKSSSQASGSDLRSFFGGAGSKPSVKSGVSPTKPIEISDDDDSDVKPKAKPPAPKQSSAQASSSKPQGSTKRASNASRHGILPDSDEDMEEATAANVKKAAAKKRKSVASSDDEEEDEPPKKKVTKAPRKSNGTTEASKPKAKASNIDKSAAKAKPPKKAKKQDDDEGDDDGATKPEPTKKPNWAAVKAAQMARSAAGGSGGVVPEGKPNCLAGLTFVFTGELPNFSREEAQDAAKRYGGRITGAPSGKTDYVVLGENAGPKKLETIRKLKLETVDEAGFLDLIATRDGHLDEATIAKMQKAEEQIKKDAQEIEARERREAKEAKRPGTSAKVVDRSGQLWTSKYAPQTLKEICGNKGQVEKLNTWLGSWEKSHRDGFKKPGKDAMGIFRAVLISGPPGIGKTTAAHLIAKLNGYTPIEVNASDARNKKLVENSTNITNKSLDGWLGGGPSTNVAGVEIHGKACLIMDEVDGMSGGDRGGVGALNGLIKKTGIPIICIANDRSIPKMKPLQSTTYNLAFKRPKAAEMKSRLMTIAYREKLTFAGNAMEQLVASSQSDMRQVLNMMSTWKLTSNSMDFDDSKVLGDLNEKHSIMTPFTVIEQMFGPYMFGASSRKTLNDKIDMYFHDFGLVPLMVQENYLKTSPRKLIGLGQPDLELKALEILDAAASAISDGDLVDALIHSPEQHWSLMPLHAVHSTVRPAAQVYGMASMWGQGPNVMGFPSWLGQNSKQSKLQRQLGEIQIRMRLRVTGNKAEIRQQYIPALFPSLVQPLMDDGADAIPRVIETMDEYLLSKEEWDYLVELGVGNRENDLVLKGIQPATKASFTRKYNASDHPVAFHKESLFGKAKTIAAAEAAPDVEDAYDLDDEVPAVDEEEVEAPDDFSKDKMVKQAKPKKPTAKVSTAKPKTTKARPKSIK